MSGLGSGVEGVWREVLTVPWILGFAFRVQVLGRVFGVGGLGCGI